MSDKKKGMLYGMSGSLLGSIPGAVYLVITVVNQEKNYIPALVIALGSFLGTVISAGINSVSKIKERDRNKTEYEKEVFDPQKYVKEGTSSIIGIRSNVKTTFLEEILSTAVSLVITYFAFNLSTAILLNRMFNVNLFIAFFQAVPRFFMESSLLGYFAECSVVIVFFRIIMLIKIKIWGF